MSFWATFWTAVFALTILVYCGLVVVVTIGGWKDVRAMFKTLDQQHENADEN